METDFYEQGSFLCIDGPAKKAGKEHANVKVCFVSNDPELLRSLLQKLAESDDCYWVKMTKKDRDGMYLGRCFFTTADRAGEVWAKYKGHPKLMVNIQDDDFASKFREMQFSWKDKPATEF